MGLGCDCRLLVGGVAGEGVVEAQEMKQQVEDLQCECGADGSMDGRTLLLSEHRGETLPYP